MTISAPAHRLIILYGVGGLSDVGRHAIEAALESHDIKSVRVLTRYPDMVNESNWNCGCEQHPQFAEKKELVQVVPVQSWKKDDLTSYFEDATAVVSCLGHRQPKIGYWEAAEGNAAVIRAMEQAKNGPKRVVVCSSVGIEEDWPAMEFWAPGKYILSALFMSLAYPAFRDLTKMERQYKATADIDYLFVRPVGIGEDVKPVNRWVLQNKKYEDDRLGFNMAKLDVARYMVQEAMNPTRHRSAVVIGNEKEEKNERNESAEK